MNDLTVMYERLRNAKQRETLLRAKLESSQLELEELKKKCRAEFKVELSALPALVQAEKQKLAQSVATVEEKLNRLEMERGNYGSK